MTVQRALKHLKKHLPHVIYEPGESFFWSPKHQKITYDSTPRANDSAIWALLHESAHAILNHQKYSFDIDLLLLEVEAWDKAKDLAQELGVNIDENHIQDCLDTYRDWLHQRATCPRCSTVSLQSDSAQYNCHNCQASWTVSSSRFCRPYRRQSLATSH